MRSIILILITATCLSLPTVSRAEKCDARCWYVKYKKEEREAEALAKKNKGLRKVINKRSKLAKRIVPWVQLRGCETNGITDAWRYGPNHPRAQRDGFSGFYGGLQFNLGTWRAYGGREFASYPHEATPIQQVAVAQEVLKKQGRMAWPHCTRIGAW